MNHINYSNQSYPGNPLRPNYSGSNNARTMQPPLGHRPNMGQYNRQNNQQITRQLQPQSNNSQGLPFPIGSEGQYILYYSNFCINCKEFITLLCKTPVYSSFTNINVSSNVGFPSFVKSVPTIIVPKIQRPLVGEEVFKWLEDQSTERIKNGQGEISPYSPEEMESGLGDSYSYLDSKDTDQPMEHTFSFITRDAQKIETPPEESFVNTKPKKGNSIEMTNRQPFPQTSQNQMPFEIKGLPSQGAGGRPPMIPSSSLGDDGKNVEDAYNELLARRKMDIPSNPPS